MAEPLTRRGFLTKSSLAAAAGVAATVAATSGVSAAGLFAAAPAAAAKPEEVDVTALGHDVVAHIRNASTGEVSVMFGEQEVVYTDRALVARLLKAARQAGREA